MVEENIIFVKFLITCKHRWAATKSHTHLTVFFFQCCQMNFFTAPEDFIVNEDDKSRAVLKVLPLLK